jgi:ABC-type Fe3+-hydroxamate transport system substrate-binding protein
MKIQASLTAAAILFLGACTDAGSDESNQESEIAETASVSDWQGPPFGFELYPDSSIVISTPEGRVMQIETPASREDIASFYQGEMERIGYTVQSVETSEERTKVRGSRDVEQDAVVQVSIAPAESGPNRYSIIFQSKGGE